MFLITNNSEWQAASLLKRAEGIVSLTVCNPNKSDDKKTKQDDDKTPKKSTYKILSTNEYK